MGEVVNIGTSSGHPAPAANRTANTSGFLKMFALLASTQLLETDLFGPAGLNFMKMQVRT
jgi:hypothetical protein